MQSVRSGLEDADLAFVTCRCERQAGRSSAMQFFDSLRLKVPAIAVLNKIDRVSERKNKKRGDSIFTRNSAIAKKRLQISALHKTNTDILLNTILDFLPEGEPFYYQDDLTDLPTRFFVGEMIREKIFGLFEDEIPYHTAVIVTEFKENRANKDNGRNHCA